MPGRFTAAVRMMFRGPPRGDVCGMIRVTYSQCLVNAVLDLQQ